MQNFKRFFVGFVALAICLTTVALAQPGGQAPQNLSILFEPGRGYEVDGKPIRTSKLEKVLRESHRTKSREAKVTVLLHEKARLSELSFLRGLLQAIGFLHIRFYSFIDNKEMMAELVVDRAAVPFTLTPEN